MNSTEMKIEEPIVKMDPLVFSDPDIIKGILDLLQTRDPKRYQVFQGSGLYVMITDCKMVDVDQFEEKEGRVVRRSDINLVPVLNIVKVGIDETTLQGRGLFTSFLTWLLSVVRATGIWSYVRIECILTERFLAFLKRRTDIVHEDWNDNQIWIRTHAGFDPTTSTALFLTTQKHLVPNTDT